MGLKIWDGEHWIEIPNSNDLNKEANLTWGGKNLVADYSPVDAAMVPELGANRLAFMDASAITVEYSRDSGYTWLDYGANAQTKMDLFNGNSSGFYIGKHTSVDGVDYTNFQLRITVDCHLTTYVYTTLNKFCILVSSNGSNGSWCTIDGIKQTSINNNSSTWDVFANKVAVAGWSGYNIINTTGITTYGGDYDNQYRKIRFTFGNTGYSTIYSGLRILKILGFGGVGWSTPSTMAKNGNIYTYDYQQNVTFPATVYAPAISGTTLYENNVSLASKYLGLAGGTLTGTLTTPTGKKVIEFRDYNSYHTNIQYAIVGNEALIFQKENDNTSFIFRTGSLVSSDWTTIVPSLQIKNGGVTINKLIGNGALPAYKLDVNGTTNISGHLSLDGGTQATSTGNTSQIVMKRGTVEQWALTSNDGMFIINPTTNNTSNQLCYKFSDASLYTINQDSKLGTANYPWGEIHGVSIYEGQDTLSQKYLGIGATAQNSNKLGNVEASSYATQSWVTGKGYTTNTGTVTSVTLTSGTGIAVTSSGTAITTSGSRTISLASGVCTAGTYKSVTVDTYGRVTSGTNPTSLSGYGITDAKIASGTITLGSNTITPLTSSSSLDATKLTSGTLPASRLPKASGTTLGGVMVGAGLNVNADGKISVISGANGGLTLVQSSIMVYNDSYSNLAIMDYGYTALTVGTNYLMIMRCGQNVVGSTIIKRFSNSSTMFGEFLFYDEGYGWKCLDVIQHSDYLAFNGYLDSYEKTYDVYIDLYSF